MDLASLTVASCTYELWFCLSFPEQNEEIVNQGLVFTFSRVSKEQLNPSNPKFIVQVLALLIVRKRSCYSVLCVMMHNTQKKLE